MTTGCHLVLRALPPSLDFPTRLLKDRRWVLKNSYHYLVFANGREGQAWGLSPVISAPGRLGRKNGQCEASLGKELELGLKNKPNFLV